MISVDAISSDVVIGDSLWAQRVERLTLAEKFTPIQPIDPPLPVIEHVQHGEIAADASSADVVIADLLWTQRVERLVLADDRMLDSAKHAPFSCHVLANADMLL